MCSLKQAFILKQLYITSSSVRLHKATWPAGFRTWGLEFDTRAVFLRLCCLYVCVFQREELWSTCVDSAEVSIWHIKDTSKPFHRLVLPDCGACHCLIKVKNQVGKHTHTHAHTHTPPKALRPQLWLLSSAGVDRRCWPRLLQREDLHPGRRALPGPEGAARPQRQGDGALLGRGPLRPQRGGEKRRQDRNLEGGVAVDSTHLKHKGLQPGGNSPLWKYWKH